LKTHRLKYGSASDMNMNFLTFQVIRQTVLKQCYAQGIAAHSQDQGEQFYLEKIKFFSK